MSDIDFLDEASSLSGDGGDDDGSPPVAGPRLAAEVAAPVSDSDVDFLAEASSDEEPALAAPVVPAADAADAVPARRRRARRADRDVAEPRVSIYGMPSERTELQHALLTAKMREKKAQTAYRKACSAQAADLVNQFNDLIASSGVPSRTALSLQVPRWMSGKSHKRKHIGNLKIIATTHRRMAPISKLAMAYSGVHCIKSLATMFQCDASTIEYNQRLVAVAFLDLQAMLVERVVEAIQTAQLTFAIVTTRSDETGERLAYTGILGTESPSDSVGVAGAHQPARLHLRFRHGLLHLRVRLRSHPSSEHRCGVVVVCIGAPPLSAACADHEEGPSQSCQHRRGHQRVRCCEFQSPLPRAQDGHLRGAHLAGADVVP